MKMPNTAKRKANAYKLLDCIKTILFDCISHDTLLTMHELSQLDVALTSLKNVIDSHLFNYQYSDVLGFEVSCFRAKVIPYIDYASGNMKMLPFEVALKEKTAVSKIDKRVFNLNRISKYEAGNLAIGQIYIKGVECFSTKLALEHSLQSTAIRWYNNLDKIKSLIEQEGGMTKNVIF